MNSDRFENIYNSMINEDYGTALTLLCPLIDRAGKEIYGLKKVGERFRLVIQENNEFLYWYITDGLFVLEKGADFSFSREGKEPINLAQSIYKYVRNGLLHDGDLSEEIQFVKDGKLGPGDGKISFPENLVWGLVFMVSCLPCYKKYCPREVVLNVNNTTLRAADFWGDQPYLESFFASNVFPPRGVAG